jgi:hypothetical protein
VVAPTGAAVLTTTALIAAAATPIRVNRFDSFILVPPNAQVTHLQNADA